MTPVATAPTFQKVRSAGITPQHPNWIRVIRHERSRGALRSVVIGEHQTLRAGIVQATKEQGRVLVQDCHGKILFRTWATIEDVD